MVVKPLGVEESCLPSRDKLAVLEVSPTPLALSCLSLQHASTIAVL